MFNYDPLWKTMENKGISQYQLIKNHGFSTGTLDALRKNRSITMNTLERLCLILNCTPDGIIQIVRDTESVSGAEGGYTEKARN